MSLHRHASNEGLLPEQSFATTRASTSTSSPATSLPSLVEFDPETLKTVGAHRHEVFRSVPLETLYALSEVLSSGVRRATFAGLILQVSGTM